MGGDQIAFVGGAAYHGFQMLSFSGSDGVDVDAYQMIDLSYYRDAIAQSNVTFETSIMVNFVNTASRDFQLWVRFYEGSTVLPVSSYVRYSVDVDADTWEQVSLPPGVLPPTADHAEFHLRVDAGVTWSGYYMDWAQFILVIPGQPPPPAGPVLIIR
jgi:hypothetical protein